MQNKITLKVYDFMKKDQIVMTGQYQDHRLTFEGQNRKLNEVPTNITFESKNDNIGGSKLEQNVPLWT